MEILKSIRDKFGLSQHDMATLLGMTNEHYSMVEIGRIMLPAEAAQRFAALMFLYQQNFPLVKVLESIQCIGSLSLKNNDEIFLKKVV